MELKLIADIGLVGLPNAGKSTLLKALTKANPKIGAYPFTTLHPNLGVLPLYEKSYVVADIPGLIEGASKGVGLGDEFLRHIERTKYILHLVDMSGMSGDPYQNYLIINKELAAYSKKLAKKTQLLVLNKTDVPESAENIKQFLKQAGKVPHVAISAAAHQNIEELKQEIAKLFQ
jgi:GTP-binding protein